MKRLWPGWLLCVLTAGLLAYMFYVKAPDISGLVGGMKIPDQLPLGYDMDGARALFMAFVSDHAISLGKNRPSASEAYVLLHAGYDLVFPPMLTASLGFLAFAALYRLRQPIQTPRMAAIGFGLVLALAFTYLACDFIENSVADAMFGPKALELAFNEQFVFVLQVLTRGKFASAGLALGLIAALWVWRWTNTLKADPPLTEA
ncbi:hypothetical protein WNZ14_09475 [Hoeflea sp. AS60]|uniref:hypothetical protein n=1 Tax=Hoeflea sp. AS60 TaxID=3135780 RepID=UPI00317D46C7